jgi:cytochrome c553
MNTYPGTKASRALSLVALVAAIAINCGTAFADEEGKSKHLKAAGDWMGSVPVAPTEDWKVAFGGRMYDGWYNALARSAPKSTHPNYPSAGKQKGASTWRCKECHGWDYKGKDGAYSKGSHFTGIPGLQELIGADPQRIHKALMDNTHKYTHEMIPLENMLFIALFVTRGQHDVDMYIDGPTKRARGDAAEGERYYQNICAACHGFDGKAINFHDADDPEYIGTVAKANPWEALHKIRNGQPGVPMPALRVLPTQTLVDILAYTQTLPAK